MTMDHNAYERMATMEAKLGQIESLLTKLDDKLDNMNTAFVPRMEIEEKFRHRDEKIVSLQSEIIQMKQDKQQNKALLPAWIGVIVAIAALLAPLFY